MPNSMMIIIMNQQGENTEFILFDTTGTSTGIITRLHPQGKGGPKGVRRWRLALDSETITAFNLMDVSFIAREPARFRFRKLFFNKTVQNGCLVLIRKVSFIAREPAKFRIQK